MTIAVIVSLLIGLAAAALGLWDLHKINKVNGQVAASVPATSVITPTSGQTISGVVNLDAVSVGPHVASVQFVATGGASRNVLIANSKGTFYGWIAPWNSANLPNGTYQISSVGYNANGESSRSPGVAVRIQNP